uniref:Uncharacterized protein n=1 Tax=Oryza rufipogon TaxID=4529 RepID=A0A0E0PKS1_ORYRU
MDVSDRFARIWPPGRAGESGERSRHRVERVGRCPATTTTTCCGREEGAAASAGVGDERGGDGDADACPATTTTTTTCCIVRGDHTYKFILLPPTKRKIESPNPSSSLQPNKRLYHHIRSTKQKTGSPYLTKYGPLYPIEP